MRENAFLYKTFVIICVHYTTNHTTKKLKQMFVVSCYVFMRIVETHVITSK